MLSKVASKIPFKSIATKLTGNGNGGIIGQSQAQSVASKQLLPTSQHLFGSSKRFCGTSNNASNEDGVAVGIDLGTTNSVIAICEQSGNVKIIENSEGSRTTPSCVGFHSSKNSGIIDKLVGKPAKNQATTNPLNTFMSVKRLMGRQFNDPIVSKIKSLVSYNIVNGNNNDAWVYSPLKNEKYSPSQVGSWILSKLKNNAEDYVGSKVTEAVITVPAYFNAQQRQATKDAGTIAGLNVKRVINEPTAAALAYGLDSAKNSNGNNDETIAVYDLGGGTFDISILSLSDGVFEVLATNGDTTLGGDNFDEILLKHISNEFEKTSNIDLLKDPLALQRLKEESEKCRKALDNQFEYEINLPFICIDKVNNTPLHLNMVITKSSLEQMMKPLIDRTLAPCEQCIKDAHMTKDDITSVVLVGGMTRMPQVSNNVEKYFGKIPCKSVNPDEVVATGAAIQAGIQTGKTKSKLIVIDVIPLSLGIETLGGVFTKLIEKNAKIPCKKSEVYSTASNNQSMVNIKVFQGERPMVIDNKLLGNFDLVGIPPAPRGIPQIEVTFDIDANAILTASAKDKKTGKEHKLQIQTSGGLTQAEIEKMVQESIEHEKMDNDRRKVAELKNNADTLVWQSESQLDSTNDDFKIDDSMKNEIRQAINDVRDKNNNCNDISQYDELKESMEKLNKALSKIGEKIYGEQGSTSNDSNNDQQSQDSQNMNA